MMRRKAKRRATGPRLEPLEPRPLLSTLIALVDYGVDLNNNNIRGYYDLADAFNSYTGQLASQAGNGVVQATAPHGIVLTNATVQGIVDTSSQPGVSAPDVKILPIKYSDSSNNASYAAIIRGIYYAADHGAAVINISIGQPYIDPYDVIPRTDPWVHDPAVTGTLYYLSDAIRYAESKGSVVVTAAGNDGYQNQTHGVDIDGSLTWPIYPAYTHTANMLVAASVDATGTLYPGSNWGPTHVDVGAFWDPTNSNWQTSYAAGYVSGVTGTIAALGSGLTGDALASFIKSTVQVDPALSGKVTTNGEISPANAVRALLTPRVARAATASPATVAGTTTVLSVLGVENGSDSGLTYTWSAAEPAGAPAPTFSVNGTHDARTTTVSFFQTGTYIFTATISDGSGRTATSQVAVTVAPVPTSITITPASPTVPNGGTMALSAVVRDQFGAALSPQPSLAWAVDGGRVGGMVDQSGLYKAPALGLGQDMVRVSSGTLSRTVAVAVIPPPGAFLIDPVSTGASSNYGPNAPSFASDGSGLSAPLPTGTSIPVNYPFGDTNFYHNFLTNGNGGAGTESITFQLAYTAQPAVDILGFHWWAYSADQPERSIKTANVSTSADGIHYSNPVPMTFYEGSNTPDSGRDYWFPASGIRFVKFSNLVNYGPDTRDSQSFAALSEIRFIAAPSHGLAIDAGSTTAVGPFQADTAVMGGALASTTSPIDTSGVANAAPPSVYQTERFGDFTYIISNLPANTPFLVRLHFAEIYWDAPGRRLFNVAINGTQVLTNFDILATAGAKNKAVVKQFVATADSSGRITIRFTSVKDNAKISGIEIIPLSAA